MNTYHFLAIGDEYESWSVLFSVYVKSRKMLLESQAKTIFFDHPLMRNRQFSFDRIWQSRKLLFQLNVLLHTNYMQYKRNFVESSMGNDYKNFPSLSFLQVTGKSKIYQNHDAQSLIKWIFNFTSHYWHVINSCQIVNLNCLRNSLTETIS